MREAAPAELAALKIDLLMQAVARAYALDASRLPRPLVEAAAAMLLRRIVWADCDLAAGHSFNEFHFIVRRAALNEFRIEQARQIPRRLTDSLSACGLLALNDGQRSALETSGCHKPWRPGTGIHQRIC